MKTFTLNSLSFEPNKLDSARTILNGAMDKVPDEAKTQAYQAWLGYNFSNMKNFKWTTEDLVREANRFAMEDMRCSELPRLLNKTVGKMGLKGVPGLSTYREIPGIKPKPEVRGVVEKEDPELEEFAEFGSTSKGQFGDLNAYYNNPPEWTIKHSHGIPWQGARAGMTRRERFNYPVERGASGGNAREGQVAGHMRRDQPGAPIYPRPKRGTGGQRTYASKAVEAAPRTSGFEMPGRGRGGQRRAVDI